MGINSKESVNLLSKIESIESQKLDNKQKQELGFNISEKSSADKESVSKEKEVETSSSKVVIEKDRDMGLEL